MANSLTSLTTAVAMFASAGSIAYAGGTEQQRQACMSDAFKLCSAAMPDEGRVENCLRSAGPQLSRGCYDVFYPQSANNQAGVTRGQAAPRDRMQPSAPERMQTPSMPQMPPAGGGDDD